MFAGRSPCVEKRIASAEVRPVLQPRRVVRSLFVSAVKFPVGNLRATRAGPRHCAAPGRRTLSSLRLSRGVATGLKTLPPVSCGGSSDERLICAGRPIVISRIGASRHLDRSIVIT